MNVREGIDITKMAISAMLLVLVIGAALSLWYMLEDHHSGLQTDLDRASNSASMEKLYELRDMSETAKNDNKPDKYPLVSNVANAISEFNENSLLFIYIEDEEDSILNDAGTVTGATYTYKGVTLNTMPNVHMSVTPTTQAVKLLLRYSKYRCKFEIVDYTYKNLTYTGIKIRILNSSI